MSTRTGSAGWATCPFPSPSLLLPQLHMRRKHSARNPCAPPAQCRCCTDGGQATYEDVVEAYIRNYRRDADQSLEFFRQCPSIQRAIEYAARCKLPSGKRHPHQYRLSGEVLAEGERNLQACAAELGRCRSFDELHQVVERELLVIYGIGPVTVYDAATHIGAYLGLEADRVYLHAGTAEGARAIGLEHRRDGLDPSDLPQPFQRLRAREIEDCLCIYKRRLASIHAEEV